MYRIKALAMTTGWFVGVIHICLIYCKGMYLCIVTILAYTEMMQVVPVDRGRSFRQICSYRS